MIPRLKELFTKEIRPSLKEQFGYKNHYMVPEIQKVVLNMGLGIEGNDSKIIKSKKLACTSIIHKKIKISKAPHTQAKSLTNVAKATLSFLKLNLYKKKSIFNKVSTNFLLKLNLNT